VSDKKIGSSGVSVADNVGKRNKTGDDDDDDPLKSKESQQLVKLQC
jgi:hypothetical protein